MAKRALWAILTVLGLALPIRADYMSRTLPLDVSDSFPRGSIFGSVTIEAYDGSGAAGGGLGAGQVRMTFDAATLPLYGPTDPNFGFTQLGFNTHLTLSSSQIQTPTGWNLRNDRFMGGFGKFGWQAHGLPSLTPGPVVITVNGLGSDATLDHFLIPSLTSTGEIPVNGMVYFAGRIGGFDVNSDSFDLTSHVAGALVPILDVDDPVMLSDPGGASNPEGTPEPTTWLLGLCGSLAIGIRRWWTT